MLTRDDIRISFQALQQSICDHLEDADGSGRFISDKWERPGGGGGISRILNNGRIIEKGGVNFSAVFGKAPPTMLKILGVPGNLQPNFFATGISIVLHPFSPMVPIIHMNIRYFELEGSTWWFGGGIDLTPHYVDEEDTRYFHQHLKNVCDKHHASYYGLFKNEADDYFFIKHRNETRGVGGIFFDHLSDGEGFSKEQRFEFIKDIGLLFAPLYSTLMKRNQNKPFSDKEKVWQALRRGRYVEFNLVYDRGTKFGLETEGRTESILMSMPPAAQWIYDYQPEKGGKEAKTLSLLRKGIDWV